MLTQNWGLEMELHVKANSHIYIHRPNHGCQLGILDHVLMMQKKMLRMVAAGSQADDLQRHPSGWAAN